MNGHIRTLNTKAPVVSAVAIKDNSFLAAGSDKEILAYCGDTTKVIELKGRTVIPGLNDSHIHVIRGGLNYNLELRLDGVPSLFDALKMLRDQAERTPPSRWVLSNASL